MSEVAKSSFRTKTGICTVTSDRIVLTREGARGALAEMLVGNSIGRILVIYGALGTAALAYGVWSLLRGDAVTGAFFGLIGAFFLWNVVASRGNSAAPVIERAAIRSVEAHPPRRPATRGYFNVWFEEDGKVRKRIIMLPGSLENGSAEYERAEAVMREAGLLTGA